MQTKPVHISISEGQNAETLRPQWFVIVSESDESEDMDGDRAFYHGPHAIKDDARYQARTLAAVLTACGVATQLHLK